MSSPGEEQTTPTENGSDAQQDNPEVISVRRGMFGPEGTGDTSGYGRLVRPVELPGSAPAPVRGLFR